MATYIALLRGINIGGHKRIAMADLRGLTTKLGFEDPQTLLQSGNLVFRTKARATAPLEQLLEEETKKRLSVETSFFLRTADEWESLIAGNPFPAEAKRDPAHLVVICFKGPPDAKAVKALQGEITGPEIIRAKERQAYVTYPDGIGQSPVTLPFIESRLGMKGTGRNWNTVMKLAGLVSR